MSLLDSNSQIIIGKEPKYNWKDYIRGIKPSWDLKNQQETLLGKFKTDDKKNNEHILYNSDDLILIKLHIVGSYKPRIEINDSKNVILAKTSTKMGLTTDTVRLENSQGEKILECKTGLDCTIQDSNENAVAELKLKRFKNDFTINILDPKFDKKMILGFSLALLLIMSSGAGGVSNL